MEMSQIALNHGLTFLVWTTGVVLIVVAGFLIKLLIDLSKLSKNVNQTTEILNTELKPTLEAVTETLQTVNGLVKTTDQGFGNAKDAIEKIISKTKLLSGTIFGGFMKGFVSILSLFSKK